MPKRCRSLIAAGAVVSLLLTACGTSKSSNKHDSAGPKRGGAITLGGFTFTQLDPGRTGYIQGANYFMRSVYGSLLAPGPAGSSTPYVGSLAQSYTLNSDSTALTIKLRPGLKFQDGTPLDAKALVWNLNRYHNPQSTNNQYFGTTKSIKAVGEDSATVTFSQPNSAIVAALATTSAGFMASPTAYDKLGADKFSVSPVGAGPYKVTSAISGQSLQLGRSADYWDAAHSYLDKITLKNTGTDDNVQYTNLRSGAVSAVVYTGILSSPAVLAEAKKNTSLGMDTTPDVLYLLLPMNTLAPPFDNEKARQALAYCTDRESLAKNVAQGFASAAYVLAGKDSQYLPDGGYDATKKLMPYSYDAAKAKDLVSQLPNGLSFKITTYNVQGVTVATALQQLWKQCGITAKIDNIQPTAFLQNLGTGAYQTAVTNTGGSANPLLWTSYQTPSNPVGKYGFRSNKVTSLIAQSYATDDTAEQQRIWSQIWSTENQLAVDLPIMSSGRYVFYNKCLHGINEFDFGPDFTQSYLGC